MAVNTTGAQSITFTLTGTTADTVSVAGNNGMLRIINHGTTPLWVRTDGQAAVADAAGCYLVPPNFGANTVRVGSKDTVSVVGATPGGNKVTVEALGT